MSDAENDNQWKDMKASLTTLPGEISLQYTLWRWKNKESSYQESLEKFKEINLSVLGSERMEKLTEKDMKGAILKAEEFSEITTRNLLSTMLGFFVQMDRKDLESMQDVFEKYVLKNTSEEELDEIFHSSFFSYGEIYGKPPEGFVATICRIKSGAKLSRTVFVDTLLELTPVILAYLEGAEFHFRTENGMINKKAEIDPSRN